MGERVGGLRKLTTGRVQTRGLRMLRGGSEKTWGRPGQSDKKSRKTRFGKETRQAHGFRPPGSPRGEKRGGRGGLCGWS